MIWWIVLTNVHPIAGKPKQNMVPHLIKCPFVSREARESAIKARDEEKPQVVGHGRPGPSTHSSLSVPSLARSSSWTYGTQPYSSNSPLIGSYSATPSPLLMGGSLLTFSLPDEDQTQAGGKRRRTGMGDYINTPVSASPQQIMEPWSALIQQEFNRDFCRFLIANRLSWNVANNPQTRLFFQRWIPGAIVPDRRTLSGPVLDKEASKVEAKFREKLYGKMGTFI